MANPRDAKVPTALGHTLGYGSIPGWPGGGGGGGGAELHIGRASIKQPSKSVNPRDPATMQAIVDARWALTLRERVNPVRELTLFARRKNSGAAAELAELACQSYGQRSAALYPRPAAALPRSASASAVRTREPEPRNTLTGQGMELNEGFDIRDGKGGGRNGTAYNHALWREGCGLEGSGRRVALVKPAPYSWRNYATDGSSELGVEVRALVERPAALHRANIARAAAAAAPPAAVSLPSSQPRGSSDLSGLKPRHGDAIARSAYPGDRNTFVAPRPSTPHVAQFRHSTQARDGMSRPPISSAEIPSGAAIQSDSGPQSSHPSAAGLAPARRGLGSSVSSPGFLGWSAPKMGGSGGGGGGEGGGGNGGGGAGGGAALTVGCGSVVGTVSAQQRHENLVESAAPLGRDAAPASVVMLSETGARLGSSQLSGEGGRGVTSQLGGKEGRDVASQLSKRERQGVASQVNGVAGQCVASQLSGSAAREAGSQLGGARVLEMALKLSGSLAREASCQLEAAATATPALSVGRKNTNAAIGSRSALANSEPVGTAASDVRVSEPGSKGSSDRGTGGLGSAHSPSKRRQGRWKAKAAAAEAAARTQDADAQAAFAFLGARARSLVETGSLPPPTEAELGSLEYRILVERNKAAAAMRMLEAPEVVRPPWVHDGSLRRPPSAGRPWQTASLGAQLQGYATSKIVAESRAHAWAGGTLQGPADLVHLRPSSLQPPNTIEQPLSKHDYYKHCLPTAHPPNPKVDIGAPAGTIAGAASFARRGPAWH